LIVDLLIVDWNPFLLERTRQGASQSTIKNQQSTIRFRV